MNDSFDGECTHRRAGAIDSLSVSRRGFLRGTLAVSSLVAAGLPARAFAMGPRTTTNVLVSSDGYPSHLEPCLAVNPGDPRNLLAACSLPVPVATFVSFDGGLTWRSNGPLPPPTGTSGGSNVSVGFDGTGRGFVCALMVASGSVKTTDRGVYVWRTEDGGRNFTQPVAVTALGNLDRPWLATERQCPSTIHVVWAEGPNSSPGLLTDLGYARSTDGGVTFEAPRTIASITDGLGNPMVVCGPHGSVYIIYSAGAGALEIDPDTPSTVTVVCSQNGGQTFGQPIPLGQATDLSSFPGLTSPGSALPAIATDPNRGVVCAAFTKHDAGAAHADVLLAASQDAGRTWSSATAVTPQDQVIYFEPQVAIDDAGRIGVMAFALAQDLVSVVLILSEPNSLHFGRPITVTDQPFDPAVVANRRGRWELGNYQALAATPNAFHPLWNDTRTGQLQLFTAMVRP